MLDRLRRRLHLRKECFRDGVVLDVGAGDHGRGTVGVDLRRAEGVDVLGDGTDLPVATDAVDASVCYHVVEHLEPAAVLALLDELHRVTRPDGTVHILVDRDTSRQALLDKDPTHVRRYDPGWLRREFARRFAPCVQAPDIIGYLHNHLLAWPPQLDGKWYLEGEPA